jgi:hypothetical protein
MTGDGKVQFRYNQAAKADILGAVHSAVEEIFNGPILDDARAGSPVDTGENRDSIKVLTTDLGPKGVLSELYTTSGYGGHLELGHKVRGDSGAFVEGRPYLYPAVLKNIDALRDACRNNISTSKAKRI